MSLPALLLSAGVGLALMATPTNRDENSASTTAPANAANPIGNIVDAILKSNKRRRAIDVPNYKDYDHTISTSKGEGPEDEEEVEGPEFVNPKKELKAITTDLVNKAFLARKSDVFNFLKLVTETHTAAIKLYVTRKKLKPSQVHFVYKGGNVLRIVASEFLVELPGYASDTINDFYMKFFKRSDADFSIYIDPALPNFDEVHHELCLLTWQTQRYIREKIMQSPQNFFEYFRLNTRAKRSALDTYLDQLNHAQTLEDSGNDRFFGGRFDSVAFEGNTSNSSETTEAPTSATRSPDTFIVFADEKKRNDTVTFTPDPRDTHYMRIQYNTALEFSSGGDHQASFTLVRTKIMFGTVFESGSGETEQIKLGGELIDVSVPRANDTGLIEFFRALKDTGDVLDHYELRYNNVDGNGGADVLRFQGYSLNWIINDLEYILFVSAKRPWDDSKYVKRLNRMFYLSFVQLFVHFDSNAKRKQYMKDFCAHIATKALKPNFASHVKRFQAKTAAVKKSTKSTPLGFAILAQRTADIAVQPNDPQYSDFAEYVEQLQQNCVVTLRAFANIGRFCGRQTKAISENRIYEGKFDALVAGDEI